ncbi:hypothetical protein CCHR01_17065 [Colletotrichum chrysophilum]|uniref:Uncharacterized protein n=1 Tax=Colletotrichum chrysophilum TaxID=1836956 RepID=A0AAD9A2P0_9PEZI|nr:hypothetical protein CCHR01_17065 [Colletotrichum chrysophilum]
MAFKDEGVYNWNRMGTLLQSAFSFSLLEISSFNSRALPFHRVKCIKPMHGM